MTDRIDTDDLRHPHWGVTVDTSGEQILRIETECYSGREISAADEDAIRTAAHHLLAFIGDPDPGEVLASRARGAETGWRDIATAPRDGTDFIATDGTDVFRTYSSRHHHFVPNGTGGHVPDPDREYWLWSKYETGSVVSWKPTHWMPIPALSSQPDSGEGRHD